MRENLAIKGWVLLLFLRSREEPGGAEEMDKKKLSKTKTFLRNIFEIVIEFSFIIATF